MRRIALLAGFLFACGGEIDSASTGDLTVCAAGPTLKGIDVSHYDGTVDWRAYAASGRPFAIAKATEGLSFTDSMFAANWAGMKSAGLVRGAYHFFHPADDGAQQARFFLSRTGVLAHGDLPPILDWEATDGVSNQTAWNSAQAFVDEVRRETGLTTIIYSSARFLGTIGNPTQFGSLPLWDAQYSVTCPNLPAAWSTWAFWQTTGSAAGVPGTNGAVDANLFNGDLTALLALTAPEVPEPDAGVADAGVADGGVADGGADAGSPDADAGNDADAGSGAADAGTSGTLSDAGLPPVATSAVGCSTSAPSLLLLLALVAYWPRRRRSQISMPLRG